MTKAESFEGPSNTNESVSVKPFVRRSTKFVSGVVFQQETSGGPVSEEFRCGEFETYDEALAAAESATARIEKRLRS